MSKLIPLTCERTKNTPILESKFFGFSKFLHCSYIVFYSNNQPFCGKGEEDKAVKRCLYEDFSYKKIELK